MGLIARILVFVLASVALGLAPVLAQAQAREGRTQLTPIDPNAPRLLVSGLRSADARLGFRAAQAVRDHLEMMLPRRRWWVIDQRDIELILSYGYPEGRTVAEIDVRHLSQQIRADAVVEVAARDSAGAIILEATLLLPRRAAAGRPIARVEAVGMPSAVRRLADRIAADSLLAAAP